MRYKKQILILVVLLAILSIIASATGIFTREGDGKYIHRSIRDKDVEIYGKGIYKHMSADVAIQGIAQDYITLSVGVIMLLISLILFLKRYLSGYFILSGTAFYFFVTYLFYTTMGMYNPLFLIYSALIGISFFTLVLTIISYGPERMSRIEYKEKAMKAGGIFLIVNSILIAFMWLGVIAPPLLDGTVYPEGLHHYTTLIVQGIDLGLLLPICFVGGLLALKRSRVGYHVTVVYTVFLSLLMTALSSKIIFMAIEGVNVVPAIFIIPTINVIAIVFAVLLVRSTKLKGIER